MPDCVGVPLIVMVLDAQAAVIPAGNPDDVPIPVAPIVVCLMFVNAVLIHTVGVDDADPMESSEALLKTIKSAELFQQEKRQDGGVVWTRTRSPNSLPIEC